MSCNNLNWYGYLLNKFIIYLKKFKDFNGFNFVLKLNYILGSLKCVEANW